MNTSGSASAYTAYDKCGKWGGMPGADVFTMLNTRGGDNNNNSEALRVLTAINDLSVVLRLSKTYVKWFL